MQESKQMGDWNEFDLQLCAHFREPRGTVGPNAVTQGWGEKNTAHNGDRETAYSTRRSLLSKYHKVSRYTHKCTFQIRQQGKYGRPFAVFHERNI